ncbi:unnamed protein product, partial [Rotaria sp. Silwood1]
LSLTLLNHAIPYILLGVISLKILEKFTDNPIDALALTHAVESNRTTDMNFISWKFTVLIKENATINNLASIYATNYYEQVNNPNKAIGEIHDQSKKSANDTFTKIENQLKWPFIQRLL